MPDRSVVIIGGGISGLAAAYFLKERGIRSTIIEKGSRLGGLIRTDVVDGCRLEAGPDSFLAAKPAVQQLANRIAGLNEQVIGSNDAARQVFIVRNGQLIPMPHGMSMMVPGVWRTALRSPLFSLGTKARFLTELLTRPKIRTDDISIGEFVWDHFGNEVLAYIADPLLTGVYGGKTGELSAQSVLPRFLDYEKQYGSLIRAVRRDRNQPRSKGGLFLSFENGMQTLTDALASEIAREVDVVYEEAMSIEKAGDRWRVRLRSCSLETKDVIFACPAYTAAALIGNFAPSLASELDNIPYSSAVLVTFVYERTRLHHPLNGFGFLVPQQERRHIAATTWISTKFPSRTPPRLAAIRAFIVGDEAITLMQEADAKLLELVRYDLGRLMGIDAAPLHSMIYRWPRSMPQYVVGHERRRVRIEEDLRQHRGLFLTGNAYNGVGIPDCIRRSQMVTESLVSLM